MELVDKREYQKMYMKPTKFYIARITNKEENKTTLWTSRKKWDDKMNKNSGENMYCQLWDKSNSLSGM